MLTETKFGGSNNGGGVIETTFGDGDDDIERIVAAEAGDLQMDKIAEYANQVPQQTTAEEAANRTQGITTAAAANLIRHEMP